jgi:hypothetical protein
VRHLGKWTLLKFGKMAASTFMMRILALAISSLIVMVGFVSAADEPIQVTNSFTYPYTTTLWATCVSFKNVTDKFACTR